MREKVRTFSGIEVSLLAHTIKLLFFWLITSHSGLIVVIEKNYLEQNVIVKIVDDNDEKRWETFSSC
jgi:hypothetical protein